MAVKFSAGFLRQEMLMAATPSTLLLPPGAKAPDFRLPDTNALQPRTIGLDQVEGRRALVVMFVCNHCPFVKHIQAEITRLASDYQPKGVGFAAISSNDVERYPDDAPDKMGALAKRLGWTFPYLYDQTQDVAKAYKAACTPDFYIFDGTRRLRYRGQLDDSRPSNGVPVTGKDVRAALDLILGEGAVPPEMSKPSIGCNIKWKPGNEPEYA
jgi:peroxiredoxin